MQYTTVQVADIIYDSHSPVVFPNQSVMSESPQWLARHSVAPSNLVIQACTHARNSAWGCRTGSTAYCITNCLTASWRSPRIYHSFVCRRSSTVTTCKHITQTHTATRHATSAAAYTEARSLWKCRILTEAGTSKNYFQGITRRLCGSGTTGSPHTCSTFTKSGFPGSE